MKIEKEYIVFCRFSAIAKKVVHASNLEQAKQIAESDDYLKIDEIIKIIEPCKADEVLLLKSNDPEIDDHETVEFKSWGSE